MVMGKFVSDNKTHLPSDQIFDRQINMARHVPPGVHIEVERFNQLHSPDCY